MDSDEKTINWMKMTVTRKLLNMARLMVTRCLKYVKYKDNIDIILKYFGTY